jgi:SPP1 family predicted phage head-tail adaptor
MNPGKLNKRITFQRFIEGKDADGFPLEEWQDVKTCWAMIKTLKGREYFQSATTQNENSSRFIIRYTTGLHPDMQILYKGRTFEIESIINDDEMNKTLTIICKDMME